MEVPNARARAEEASIFNQGVVWQLRDLSSKRCESRWPFNDAMKALQRGFA